MILVSKTRPDVEVDRFGMESSGIDLRSEIPVLVLPESSNGMRRFISSTCSRAKVELSPRYVQNSVSVLKSIVRMGLASTILPHASVGDELERGLLSGREVLYPSMDRVVFIARKFAVAPDSLSAHVERTVKNCMHWMAASGYWRARPMEAG
jgi:DNA-binding transcriptional LysR family regulator